VIIDEVLLRENVVNFHQRFEIRIGISAKTGRYERKLPQIEIEYSLSEADICVDEEDVSQR